jgi:hypothetical protein
MNDFTKRLYNGFFHASCKLQSRADKPMAGAGTLIMQKVFYSTDKMAETDRG